MSLLGKGLVKRKRKDTVHLNGMLTERQSEIVEFLQECLRDQGRVPTVREIQAHFRFSSPATVRDHLELLERKDVIRREAGKARSIQLLGLHRPRSVVTVPLLGTIPAGFPESAAEQAGESLAISPEILGVPERARLFALKVRGDSMIDAGILDGDVAILESGREPVPRDIVAALIDGETTLKRFLVQRGKPFLRAENSKYPDLIPARELTIQGVFRALISTARR
jgi:repressor LexA